MFIQIGNDIFNTDHIVRVDLDASASYRDPGIGEVSVPCVTILDTTGTGKMYFHSTAEKVREFFRPMGELVTVCVSTTEDPRVPVKEQNDDES